MLLVKFSTGTFALVVVGILVLAWIRFPRTLLALTSSYILTFLAAWVISQGGVDGLAAWPRLSLSLASAFAGAMAYYPADPDIKGLAKDLGRVLRASRIG